MKNKVFSIIEMLVVIAAGLILLFKPGDTLITATRILGAALLAYAEEQTDCRFLYVFAGARDRRLELLRSGEADMVFATEDEKQGDDIAFHQR